MIYTGNYDQPTPDALMINNTFNRSVVGNHADFIFLVILSVFMQRVDWIKRSLLGVLIYPWCETSFHNKALEVL